MPEQRPALNDAAPVTGIASGSLGTGTAVDDETKPYEVPDITWRPSSPATPVPAPVEPDAAARPAAATTPPAAATPARAAPPPPAAPVDHAEPAPPAAETRSPRRDPFRPIGIALAAVLVGLAGITLLALGSEPSSGAAVPPVVTASPAAAPAGDGQQGDGGSDVDGGGNGGQGGGNNGNGGGNAGGNGNGNGPGGNNGGGND